MAIKFADTARPNNSANTTSKGTFPVAIASDVWFNDGDSLEEKWANLNSEVQTIQMNELPTATEELFGTVYQYTGDTTDDYVNGYFYQCAIVDDGSGGTAYGWVEKEVQSGTLTISAEEGQQIQQLEDGLYVHVDDWLEDVDLLPMGEDINNVMYRSTLGEPSIYIDAQITTKDEVIQALEDRGFVLDSASSSQSMKVYTVPTGTTWQCLYKYIPTGDENIKVWTTFHRIEIIYNNNDLINMVVFKNLNGETIMSLGGTSTFKLRIFLRDINHITNEYFYIGNATLQTTKRVALYDELPSSVEISEEEGNRIEKLSDGIYVGESISSVDCTAVADITDSNNTFEEGKFYYDCSDGKVYKATSALACEESDAVPMHVEITNQLYATLSAEQKDSDITWFVTDKDSPFDDVDMVEAAIGELQTNHTDTSPMLDSAKYVTSGGIYNALIPLNALFNPTKRFVGMGIRMFLDTNTAWTHTARVTGVYEFSLMKQRHGNTAHIYINNQLTASCPMWGNTSDGETALEQISFSWTPTIFVNKGDTIKITSDNSASSDVYRWFLNHYSCWGIE